ncbi:DNA/RNA helicase domain-containing protein [Cellulophaga lytica]|uniref:DNA/RNA helicase domain-containing protein n=1 Tax=Cellulophaga lytica TaxID=979 RepID=UPI000952A2AE|nr:DNA/RNA helicase domain-containing protein [Cellulophaga lytica]
MKEVNLLSIVQAYNSLNLEIRNKFYSYEKAKFKPQELNCLSKFINQLSSQEEDITIFNHFFCGYEIPQISAEFDLLRFGENYNLNIELKSEFNEGKIKKQLVRNSYYSSFIEVQTFHMTYELSTNKLYNIVENDLKEYSFVELLSLLKRQKIKPIDNLDNLFNPSNYLVSPFNSTDKFINNQYFLTDQQEGFKANALKLLNSESSSFISICGNAGTGKTLLTYDIIKQYKNNNQRALIIHCGKINQGHQKLTETYNWEIIPAKNTFSVDFSQYKVITIDETQRIYPMQLEHIITQTIKHRKNCIFSYDSEQCLRTWEANNKIAERIQREVNPILLKLTKKIRTNKEIASFINLLFDESKRLHKFNSTNIFLNYFDTTISALKFITYLSSDGWKVINYTSSNKYIYPYDEYKLGSCDNTHDVIGQEFDNVVAVIDSNFYYKKNRLSTRGYHHMPYYHPSKMLFQILTRTRKKLNIVIINNPIIMNRCLDILKQ